MKVDRLLGYLQGRAESTSTQRAENREAKPGATPQGADAEAVKVSANFGPGEQVTSSREARVADLKAQVATGTYRQPDSEELAKVLVRDLF